jgi:hypothetical protein
LCVFIPAHFARPGLASQALIRAGKTSYSSERYVKSRLNWLTILYKIIYNIKSKGENMLIKIQSVFPASLNEIFKKLQEVNTLQYIASPYASFVSENPENSLWHIGETSNYKLKIFCFIPMGLHTIKVIKFDKENIYTKEYNKYVKVWNHKITLKKLDESKTIYEDEVEIKAGIRTIFIYCWAVLFYKHRQKKWVKLLRNI